MATEEQRRDMRETFRHGIHESPKLGMGGRVNKNTELRNDPENVTAAMLNMQRDAPGTTHGAVRTSETGQRYMPRRMAAGRELAPVHAQSDRLRNLFTTGAHLRESREEINPMWHNFDHRCVTPVTTREEMEKLLKLHGQSDNVMVVRYWQEGCTACNALDKVFEFQCHEFRKKVTRLHFFDVKKEDVPELCEGMVRYPQVKAFSAGMWADMDYKPPQDFREMIYSRVEREVHRAAKKGQPVSAVQAEEMYFSVAGPAVSQVLEESIASFYNQTQVRLHNYFKQVSKRRSWYFKTYVDPIGKSQEELAKEYDVDMADMNIFGEQTTPTMTAPSAAPHDVPNAAAMPAGTYGPAAGTQSFL